MFTQIATSIYTHSSVCLFFLVSPSSITWCSNLGAILYIYTALALFSSFFFCCVCVVVFVSFLHFVFSRAHVSRNAQLPSHDFFPSFHTHTHTHMYIHTMCPMVVSLFPWLSFLVFFYCCCFCPSLQANASNRVTGALTISSGAMPSFSRLAFVLCDFSVCLHLFLFFFLCLRLFTYPCLLQCLLTLECAYYISGSTWPRKATRVPMSRANSIFNEQKQVGVQPRLLLLREAHLLLSADRPCRVPERVCVCVCVYVWQLRRVSFSAFAPTIHPSLPFSLLLLFFWPCWNRQPCTHSSHLHFSICICMYVCVVS